LRFRGIGGTGESSFLGTGASNCSNRNSESISYYHYLLHLPRDILCTLDHSSHKMNRRVVLDQLDPRYVSYPPYISVSRPFESAPKPGKLTCSWYTLYDSWVSSSSVSSPPTHPFSFVLAYAPEGLGESDVFVKRYTPTVIKFRINAPLGGDVHSHLRAAHPGPTELNSVH
jgi:hypothetical protein